MHLGRGHEQRAVTQHRFELARHIVGRAPAANVGALTSATATNVSLSDAGNYWTSTTVEDFSQEVGSLTTGYIPLGTAGKYTPTNFSTQGYIPLGNGTTLVPTNFKTANYFAYGNGTTLVSGAITGDVTFSSGVSAIGSGKVLLANLGSGISPSHVVKYAGKITWSGSGASLATTVTGVASTDILICTIQTAPTQAAYLVSCAPTTDTVTITLSAANTSNQAVIAYTVLRATS